MTVSGNNLSMTRGDSESVTVSVTGHALVSGDKIELTVRKKSSSKDVSLHKEVTEFTSDGKAFIEIGPDDTSELSFGEYTYDVQLTLAGGDVHTIIKPSKFYILEEVTYG